MNRRRLSHAPLMNRLVKIIVSRHLSRVLLKARLKVNTELSAGLTGGAFAEIWHSSMFSYYTIRDREVHSRYQRLQWIKIG